MFETRGRSRKKVVFDAPEKGIQPKGVGPTEAVLLAMAACSSMDVVSILRKMRQELRGLEVTIEGVRAAKPPRVYTSIHVEYLAQGKELSPEKVKRAVSLSLRKYCSVGVMMARSGAVVTSSVKVAAGRR